MLFSSLKASNPFWSSFQLLEAVISALFFFQVISTTTVNGVWIIWPHLVLFSSLLLLHSSVLFFVLACSSICLNCSVFLLEIKKSTVHDWPSGLWVCSMEIWLCHEGAHCFKMRINIIVFTRLIYVWFILMLKKILVKCVWIWVKNKFDNYFVVLRMLEWS